MEVLLHPHQEVSMHCSERSLHIPLQLQQLLGALCGLVQVEEDLLYHLGIQSFIPSAD